MTRPIFTGDAEAEVAQRYAEGESYAAIARDHGCSIEAVIRACKRQGVKSRGYARKLPPMAEAEVDEALRLYVDEGLSKQRIGALLGRRPEVISTALRWRGIEPVHRYARGEDHPHWRGGRRIDSNTGYVFVTMETDDPMRSMANQDGAVLEHRLVMARQLGRPLASSETVHHINGIRDDNRPENLQLRQGRHGKGATYECCDCGSHNVKPTPFH